MTDCKLQRNEKMRMSYLYAKMGDESMATYFANLANQYFSVSKSHGKCRA
jgi:hypothetical protein